MSLRSALLTPVAAAALVLAAGCGEDTGSEPATTDGGAEATGDPISRSEVEEHDSPDSCWTVIEDTVYDLTDWISEHPGGPDRIEQLCGADGTAQFTGQHGGQAGPEGQLAEFELGPVAD